VYHVYIVYCILVWMEYTITSIIPGGRTLAIIDAIFKKLL